MHFYHIVHSYIFGSKVVKYQKFCSELRPSCGVSVYFFHNKQNNLLVCRHKKNRDYDWHKVLHRFLSFFEYLLKIFGIPFSNWDIISVQTTGSQSPFSTSRQQCHIYHKQSNCESFETATSSCVTTSLNIISELWPHK